MEAEVDQIVEMINNILISNSTDAMVDHALRYLENKKAQSNHPRIVGDKWTLADIYTIVFLDAVDKDLPSSTSTLMGLLQHCSFKLTSKLENYYSYFLVLINILW